MAVLALLRSKPGSVPGCSVLLGPPYRLAVLALLGPQRVKPSKPLGSTRVSLLHLLQPSDKSFLGLELPVLVLLGPTPPQLLKPSKLLGLTSASLPTFSNLPSCLVMYLVGVSKLPFGSFGSTAPTLAPSEAFQAARVHLLRPSKLPGHVSIKAFETAAWQFWYWGQPLPHLGPTLPRPS